MLYLQSFVTDLRRIDITRQKDNSYRVYISLVEETGTEPPILAGHRSFYAGNTVYIYGGVESHNTAYSNALYAFNTRMRKQNFFYIYASF